MTCADGSSVLNEMPLTLSSSPTSAGGAVRRLRSAVRRTRQTVRKQIDRVGSALVRRGLPPTWTGYRWVQGETLRQYEARSRSDVRIDVVHPESVACNPLPCNVASRKALPTDRGWWGYSFWDVPERTSDPTVLATLRNGLVVPYVDPDREFWVGVLNADRRAVESRELHFRTGHAAVARSSSLVEVERATWMVERVYHNYSHWLTAHLPKLLLLASLDALDDVLLPPDRPSFVDNSMRAVGIEPERFATFDPSRPLRVSELTLVETDRFRPELLRSVREALKVRAQGEPRRRLYISRAKATRRLLLNEDELWPLLNRAGFERVFLEDHPFEAQVRLMQEAAAVVAPHGAGLTNVLFCAPGTAVVEIADLSFPNPNFYAVASAVGLRYAIVDAEGVGDVHPLEKNLHVDVAAVSDALECVLS